MSDSLWDYYGGEPYLQNPRLGILLNPRETRKTKRGKTMARARRRRVSRRPRRTYRRARASYRRNPVKRYRRRRSPMVRRRRSYKRNPSMLGMQLPGLNTFLFTGLGFASAPIVEGFASRFIPPDLTQNTLGKYVLKIGSIAAVAWGTKQFVGRAEARNVLIGGGVYLFTSIMSDFAPGVIPGLGAYTPVAGMRKYTPYRNLGAYTGYRNLGYAGAGVPVLPSAGNTGSVRSSINQSRFSRY